MKTYISETIGDEYMQWAKGEQIVIDAPTGSGKTYFILNVLLPHVANQGDRILYLVNRTALKRQIEEQVRAIGEAYFNHIFVDTYQDFVGKKFLKVKDYDTYYTDYGEKALKSVYWVMDEAHYFLADSSFNETTTRCTEIILGNQSKHINIFITATIPNLYFALNTQRRRPKNQIPQIPYLTIGSSMAYRDFRKFQSYSTLLRYKEIRDALVPYKEEYTHYSQHYDIFPTVDARESLADQKDHFKKTFLQYENYFSEIRENVKIYYSPRDYSQIKPVYYLEDDELFAEVEKSNPNEKWIIFVRSKRAGNELLETFLRRGFLDVVFVKSESKSRKRGTAERDTFDTIVSTEKFKQQVLITTSVLDNGINIKDIAVRHIVIDSFDQTSFLQMLGRKRILENEEINLYIKAISLGSVQKRFQLEIQTIILFLYHWKRCKSGEMIPGGKEYRATTLDGLNRYFNNGHYRSPFCHYVKKCADLSYSAYKDVSLERDPLALLDLFEENQMSVLKITYLYYYFMAFFEKCQNSNIQTDNIFAWLCEQLSWIGKTYDEAHWINYERQEQCKLDLDAILKSWYELKSLLNKEKQIFLKKKVLDYAGELRPRHLIYKTKVSLKVINNALEDWGYPYRVKSQVRSRNNHRETYWKIIKTKR